MLKCNNCLQNYCKYQIYCTAVFEEFAEEAEKYNIAFIPHFFLWRHFFDVSFKIVIQSDNRLFKNYRRKLA